MNNIKKRAENLVRRAGTRNPDDIADYLGLTVYSNLKTRKLLGMYCVKWRHRMVFLNTNLDNYTRYLVLAHEIGHDQLHRSTARSGLMQEFSLFGTITKTEYEANIFASHLLIADDDILENSRLGYSAAQIAAKLGTHEELVLIKIQELNQAGYDLNVAYEPDGSFLRNVAHKLEK